MFGSGHKTTGDNYAYKCPKKDHRHGKLEIDVVKGWWHCWSCNKGGKSFFTLFKWVDARQVLIDRLRSILGVTGKVYKYQSDTIQEDCKLPDEFIPLWNPPIENFNWRTCIRYLQKRNIFDGDILKYGIGYCEYGAYKDMLIIPSYKSNGQLNYFTGRSYLVNSSFTHKNPPVHRDIVGFDMMINWREPIILVESPLDAIAIRRNAIPIYGKSILSELRRKIIHEDVRYVNICLDADAIITAIDHISFFLNNGINVELTELQGDDDPSSLGYDKVWDFINNATKFNENILLERIVKEHLNGKGKTHIPRRRHSHATISATQRISGSIR